MNLADILSVFNTSLNEEQVWAVCYQYTRKFIAERSPENYSKGYPVATDLESICISKEGEVSLTDDRRDNIDRVLIDSFGRVLFEASDYGTDLNDEKPIGPDLERLIARMTVSYDGFLCEEYDEGYEDYDEDHHNLDHGPCTWEIVLKICEEHLNRPSKANEHYLAVCRALITEAVDLKSFLEKVSSAGESLKNLSNLNNNNDISDDSQSDNFPALNFTEWAHLWIQVVSDLRVGVKLKKTEGCTRNHEFELTPYEILMEDIRQRNYRLKKVFQNGDISRTLNRDPHDIILDFIKSRPSLKPIRDRKLPPAPPRSKSLHELLLEQIQEPPSPLRHVKPPMESPLMKRIAFANGNNNTIMTSKSCDDILNVKPDKRRLNAPPFAAELGVAVSSTEFDESDTESDDDNSSNSSFAIDSITTDDLTNSTINDDSITSPFKRHNANSNPCSLRSSGTSGVSSGGGDEQDQNSDKNGIFHRKTSTVRQKKVLAVDLPDPVIASRPGPSMDYSTSGRTPYTKFSSRGGGVKRAHTFSVKSDASAYQPYSIRPTRRELRALAAKKAVEAFAEEEDEFPLPPPMSSNPPTRRKLNDKAWNYLHSSPEKRDLEHIPRQRRRQNEKEDCVSITTDEFIAIRKKLVAHDLEQYQDRGQIYAGLKKGKICFNCRVREFNIFWWARSCQICEQKICSKCMRKVDTPFGKNLDAPVCDLRPSLSSEFMSEHALKISHGHQKNQNTRRLAVGSSLSVLRERNSEEPPCRNQTLKKTAPSGTQTAKIRKMDVCEACQNLIVRVLSANGAEWEPSNRPIVDRLKRSASNVGILRPSRTLTRSNTSVAARGVQDMRTSGRYRSLQT